MTERVVDRTALRSASHLVFLEQFACCGHHARISHRFIPLTLGHNEHFPYYCPMNVPRPSHSSNVHATPLSVLRGDADAPLEPLRAARVAVIGYGNQGRAHAINLQDSGIQVTVGCRDGGNGAKSAMSDGFKTEPISEAASGADLIIIAMPDEVQPEVYRELIEPNLKSGATIGFLHGFNIRFGFIKPRAGFGVVMIAPKGPGKTLRDRFVEGRGIPCLFAMHQDSPLGNSKSLALAWANAIGCARAGIIFTTFHAETDTDLFGEQAVLCGGMTHLILTAFRTLVEAGYPPELAYLECCHEVKQIADLVYARGLAGMMEAISNTAEFGAYIAGPKIIDESVERHMKELLARIQDGSFAEALNADHAAGFRWFHEQRAQLKGHPIDGAGETVRSLMPWLANSTRGHSAD